ncbi:hypothetical protein GF373_12150 [bacterium]|nr:hypothetical protein [bacterium]
MFLKLIVTQARHKWGINLLLFLALTAVVGLYVYMQNTSRFANRSMQLIMKNMGHNLLILPEEADPVDTYLCTDKQMPFAEDVTAKFAKHLHLASKYYVSMLQQRITLNNDEFILTGIKPVHRRDETAEKGHMTPEIPPGHARLGAMAAAELQAGEKTPITVLGK